MRTNVARSMTRHRTLKMVKVARAALYRSLDVSL